MGFNELELDDILLEELEEMGLKKPTTIQRLAIPQAMEGNDILASAPTGTGKTLAFLLPSIQFLLDFPRSRPGPARILILVPTRELANQVALQAKLLVRSTNLKVMTITGGIEYEQHAEQMRQPSDIVIATPGRLDDYIRNDVFECAAVEHLILDEADRMLDMGFSRQIERVAKETVRRKQTLLFSATLEGSGLEQWSSQMLTDAVVVNAEPGSKERGKINQYVHFCDNLGHKRAMLKHLLEQESVSHAIVFVKTRERLMELSAWLQSQDIAHSYLRGEMDQEKRTAALNLFRNKKVKALLATDVAARGIDIPAISHVINYDMPRTAEVYVHRIGRTARAGGKGTALSLVEAHDMIMLDRVQHYTGVPIKARVIEGLRHQHKVATLPRKKKVKVKKNTPAGRKLAKGKAKKAAKKGRKA